MSSCGSVTYGVAQELTKILKPLVGKFPHHINSTQDFVEQIKNETLLPGECLSSYDVSALFTSVPVDSALGIFNDLLEKDPTQGKNSNVSRGHSSCIRILPQKYLPFFTRPVLWTGWGCGYGFPSKPHCSQSIHGVLWAKSSKYCLPPPRLWNQYVDDTLVIQKEENKQNFLQYINTVDLAIHFTVENNKEDGAIPFLDTIVKPENDGKRSITVYRKLTHTDQYLQWDSHYNLSAKCSVISTLTHRAKTVWNNPDLLQKEMKHLRKALNNCNYPKWALDKVEKRLTRSTGEVNDGLTARVPQAPSPLPMK